MQMSPYDELSCILHHTALLSLAQMTSAPALGILGNLPLGLLLLEGLRSLLLLELLLCLEVQAREDSKGLSIQLHELIQLVTCFSQASHGTT